MRAVSNACKLAASSRGGPDDAQARIQHEFVSAFGEAFNNIVLHGYKDMAVPGRIQVDVRWNDEHIAVRLTDDGATFDPDLVPAPDLKALPESGMGLYIVRAFVDALEYEPGPPNTLLLSKRFRAG
jgi:serine/threonine-protein kinase RsbW